MVWKRIVISILFGAGILFIPFWVEPMWELGSWQWGALSLSCFGLGILLMNWDKWSSKFRKPKPVPVQLGNVSTGEPTAKLSVEAVTTPPWYRKLWSRIRLGCLKGIKEKVNFVWILKIAVIVCVILLLFWLFEDMDDKWIWIHPSLPESEQQKIRNECRLRSFEAIEFPDHPANRTLEYNYARRDYVNACLKSHGFELYILD